MNDSRHPAAQEAGLPPLLMRAILDHLGAHPRAADSAEGVAQWWLGALGSSAMLLDVEDALARLVASRRLRRVHLADGTVLYSKDESSGLC